MQTPEEVVLEALLTDLGPVLKDYLDVPNRCFSVSVTAQKALEDLGFESEVIAVRTSSGPEGSREGWKCWNTGPNRTRIRPKHVIVKFENNYIDVTSHQIAPVFPWVMQVNVDGKVRTREGYEYRYTDCGEWWPARTAWFKCFDNYLYGIIRGICIAALSRNNMRPPIEDDIEVM